MSSVPEIRIRTLNDSSARADGRYVLYWMTAARRPGWNFGLERAVAWARELGRPLFVLEALRCGYRWASDRHHRFVLQGMRDNAESFERSGVTYYPYVEPQPGEGRGLLRHLAERSCVLVTDDFPCFFLPRMLDAAAAQVGVRLEAIDSNGLLPMRATDRAYPTAYAFRRFLQNELPRHLGAFPQANPLRRLRLPALGRLPEGLRRRWPALSPRASLETVVADLPIDHGVTAAEIPGGCAGGAASLRRFLDRIERYDEERNQPELEVTSGLSPYLHFGHVSAHQVFGGLARREDWTGERLSGPVGGKRSGWWKMSPPAEAFLDQLVTWRELGFNACVHMPGYDRYGSLPDWARGTLKEHEQDPREHVYSLAALERAQTHDELWNAAQNQLAREGRMHNYLRMLWGKKILEWSRTPRKALSAMIELNNKYALDGRNPNSYSGIFWVLGRYDRPWGPERKVFGKIRYMSSANTARKVRVRDYLARYGA